MMPSVSHQSPSTHVWHLTWEYPPVIDGGLGVACAGIYEALDAHSDYDVEIFYPHLMEGFSSGLDAYCNQELGYRDFDLLSDRIISGQRGAKEVGLEGIMAFSAWVLGRAATAIPDIVHAHDWHSILAAVALKKVYGVPVVFHIHSTQLERVGLFAKGGIRGIEQWGITRADVVLTVSQLSAQLLVESYLVPAEKVKVVRNATGAHFPMNQHASSLSTLLFVGRFCSQKSPDIALEVFRRVEKQYPDLQLLMVGTGELLESIRKRVDFYGLSTRVKLLGMLDHADMSLIYGRSDLLLLPSIAEPCGLVALEAASAGLGVVLSDRCGAKELLPSAIVVAHQDLDGWAHSVTALIENRQQYQHLVNHVQKEAASRTWQDAAEEILAIYAEL